MHGKLSNDIENMRLRGDFIKVTDPKFTIDISHR